MRKTIISLLIISALIMCFSGCGKAETKDDVTLDTKYTVTDQITNYVLIQMKGGGKMLLELYPDTAPITVANFQKLVSEHFYDGIIFHRVIENFMIQGGDPKGTGIGGSGETITGEFASNNISNNLKHVRGTVSMGRRGNDNNSASSQFFICHVDRASLNGSYAAFGMLIDGFDTLDKIATTKTDSNDRPVEDQVMEKVVFVTLDNQG